MNNNSNRDYATENINLKQQITNLKVANKDKAETIKSMKQELLEYSQLRDRFKVLYEENQKLKKDYNLLDTTMESDDRIICELLKENEKLKKAIAILKDILNLNVTQDKHNNYFLDGDIITEITKEQYELLKEVLKLFK